MNYHHRLKEIETNLDTQINRLSTYVLLNSIVAFDPDVLKRIKMLKEHIMFTICDVRYGFEIKQMQDYCTRKQKLKRASAKAPLSVQKDITYDSCYQHSFKK